MFSLPTPPTLPKKLDLSYTTKNLKIANLIISNNTSPSTELLDMASVVYIFTCPLGDCLQRK